MTPDEQRAQLEKLLRHLDETLNACERAREHVLDLLEETDRDQFGEHPDWLRRIAELMDRDGIGFIEAMKRLAAERGLA